MTSLVTATFPHSSPGGRLPQLDFLRGVAVLMVLMYHDLFPSADSIIFRPLLFVLSKIGWSGVDLFFVLSGYLIGGLLFAEILRTGRIDLRRFLIRRAFKIWPGYFLLLAYILVRRLHHHEPLQVVWHDVWPNLFQIQNYTMRFARHTWSIAVEEHFYLVLPILVLFLIRGNREFYSRRLGIILCITPVVFIVLIAMRTIAPHECFQTQIRGADSLFLGVSLAYLHHFHPAILQRITARHRLLLASAALLLVAMYFIATVYGSLSIINYSIAGLGWACLLLALVYPPENGVFARLSSTRLFMALAWMGTYSYSIYLWHMDLSHIPTNYYGDLLYKHAQWRIVRDGSELIYIGVAIAAGVAMSKLIELPSLAIRDRLFPSRSASKTTSTSTAVDNAAEHQNDAVLRKEPSLLVL